MFVRLNRQMNEVDASPGGGTAPTQNSTPTESTPAQGDIADRLAALEAKIETRLNGVFATVRKMVEGEKPAATKPAKAESKAPAQEARTAPDPAEVYGRLRSLDRAYLASGARLGERAIARMEKAFQDERPDDASAWVTQYLDDLGVQKTASGAQVQNTATQPDTKSTPAPKTPIPASGGGNPPPPRADLEEIDLLSMSPADVQSLIQRKGLPWYNAQFAKQMRGRSIKYR